MKQLWRIPTMVSVAGLLALGGCAGQRMIPNTTILDTKLNREILQVVDEYREAMVQKNAAKILMLAHPSYQDNSGTPEPEDDVDYQGLPKLLKGRFTLADRVRYSVQFQRLSLQGQVVQIDTWIDATFVYRQPNQLPRYKRISDYHRYRLLREDGKWRFVSGL